MSRSILWEKLGETTRRDGWRKALCRKFLMPDGRTGEFDIKGEHSSACVLALTPEKNVILAKQYRPGPEKILMELPGGRIETGETPEAAIERELLEETGYQGSIVYLGSHYACAYSTATKYDFVALDCVKVCEAVGDGNEFIQVIEMTWNEFLLHLKSGELTDTTTGYRGVEYVREI